VEREIGWGTGLFPLVGKMGLSAHPITDSAWSWRMGAVLNQTVVEVRLGYTPGTASEIPEEGLALRRRSGRSAGL